MKISICIPTYNRAEMLRETLQSVAKQTVQPAEVMVIDNASTDNTEEVVKEFQSLGVRYIRNKTNIGMADNYNRCIELASNEFFTFLPSDDLIAPTWYEEWITIIKENEADLYTSPVSIMNSQGKILFNFPIFGKNMLVKQPDVLKTFLKHFTPMLVPSAATIFKKSIMKKIEPFRVEEKSECDVRPCTALFDMCTVFYYHRNLFVFREHELRSFEEEKKARDEKYFERFENYLKILKDIYEKRYKQDNAYRFFLHGNLFMNLCNINLYIVRGELQKILRSYQLVWNYFPDILKKSEDYKAFAYYQWEFIKRGFRIGKIPQSVTQDFSWLSDNTN